MSSFFGMDRGVACAGSAAAGGSDSRPSTVESVVGEWCILRDRSAVELAPRRKGCDRIVMCRAQAVATNKTKILSEEDIEACLGLVKRTATFVNRRRKYDTVVVCFAAKQEAGVHAINIQQIEMVAVLPTYNGRRSERIQFGKVLPP